MNLTENKEAVFSQVNQALMKAGRAEQTVNIIAVTKYVNSSIASQLVETGVKHLGENRVDKLLEKQAALTNQGVVWHLIGSLQRRKVKDIINKVDYFHALDSIKLAHEINKRATHTIKCFLQVNISKEETKHGFLIEELDEVLDELKDLQHIELVGLMTMAPLNASIEEIKHIFQKAKDLQVRLQARQLTGMPFTELSMGMSQDFDLAIEAGATFVRIGTAFFKEEN